MGRVGALVRNRSGGASGDALLKRDLLAHDLLYLLRGAPVVYYGDEVGMAGTGGDKAARQDMFPTQVSDWRTEPRIGSGPIGTGSSFSQTDHPIAVHLRALARCATSTRARGRRDDRPLLDAERARREPHRRGREARVRRVLQRRHVRCARHGRDRDRRDHMDDAVRQPGERAGLADADRAGALVGARPRGPGDPGGGAAKPVLKVAGDGLTSFWRLSATAGSSP